MVRELEHLAGKYARLVLLAAQRDSAARAGGFSEAEGRARRAAFRELAREFPGALRELEALPLRALLRREAELGEELAAMRAGRAAPEREWVRVVLAFHAALRELLARRQRGEKTGPFLDEAAAQIGVSRARLVAVVFSESLTL